MSKIILSLCVFVMLAITPSVRADTVIVQSGSVSLPGAFGGISYSLAGQNFSINGAAEFALNSARNCIPCLGGTFLGGSSTIMGNGLGSGFVTINGQTFVNVLFTGTLQLNASFAVPVAFTNVTLTSGGSLFASITGCKGPFLPCDQNNPIFSMTLLGNGTATLHLLFSGVNHDGIPLFSFGSLDFDFGSPVQTPEPMTITLLGAGVVGFAAKLRLSRRKRRHAGTNIYLKVLR
jgi:hypothetical protein